MKTLTTVIALSSTLLWNAAETRLHELDSRD